MNNSQIDNVQLELLPNSTIKDEVYSVSPSIAKPHVMCRQIFNEDCRETIKRFEDGSIDMVFADPFYVMPNSFDWQLFDQFYWGFNREWLTALKPKVKSTGHIFISFSSEDMARFEHLLKELGYTIKSRIVWHYRNAGGRCRGNDRFGKTYEFIFHCSFGADLNFPEKWDDKRFDVWTIAIPQSNFKEGKIHEFQKPVELLERIISIGSREGDLIYDPFCGSGTTGFVAEKMKRQWVMSELNLVTQEKAMRRVSAIACT